MKRLLVCLLLVGVVGCGESEQEVTIAALKDFGTRMPQYCVDGDKDGNVIRLNLAGGYITDEDLESLFLEGLNDLEALHLGNVVTDAGLVHLKGLTKLKILTFNNGTTITDDGLLHLKGLKQLKSLYLADSDISHTAVEALQEALPNCVIEHHRMTRAPPGWKPPQPSGPGAPE